MIDLSALLRALRAVGAVALLVAFGWMLRGAAEAPDSGCMAELSWAVQYNVQLADIVRGMADENSETYVAAGRIAGLLRDSAGGHAAGTLD